MKILILGHGRHGKDTAAEYLRDAYGLSFISSSYACAEVLKPMLDVINGEKSAEEHFAERHNHRELWKRGIALYNAADPAALARLITSQCDMYVGMRSIREYRASRELFDVVLWVDASYRVDFVDPTMEIPCPPDARLIGNNGSLGHLHAILDVFAAAMGLRRTV